MPADHSKANPTNRPRRARKDNNEEDKVDSSHAREIELKRSRGEISCAECRRLKIRCDKTIPCQSCQRRGCAALCPNGSLATGQGTRFVLAATEHLHRRIAKMGERIRQLEDALAILQAKHSNEPHPLLHDENSITAATPEQEEEMSITEPSSSTAPDDQVIEAFGTLSMLEHGVSRFFGPTGGTEYMLHVSPNLTGSLSSTYGQQTDSETCTTSPSLGSKSPESLRDSLSPPLSGELTRFSAAFPFTPVGPTEDVLRLIEGHLPSWERACHLAEAYIEHAGWLFRGVTKQQLQSEMLPIMYKRPRPDDSSLTQEDYGSPHDIALLYLIFAIGALVDLKQEAYNAEGEHYHQIARAALVLQPVLEKPSLVTIQALHLLSIYNGMAGNENYGGETSLETTWSLVAFAAQLSHSIGLHRDSARWGLPEALVNRRRLLFWNLFVADSWQSLTTGRPPSFSREYIDCQFPTTDGEAPKEGDADNDFGTWGFRFALQCVSEVAARTLTAEAPSYATIMELDRKVREFPIPPEAVALLEDLRNPQDGDEPLPLSVSMTRFVLSHSREVILLSIHRAFFAQAIIDCPENPLRSQYAPSFLAAYRASTTILKAINDQFAQLPALCARFWVIWTFAFSSAVVFGTVVTRGPRSPLAAPAIAQLDIACELFEKAAKLSRRAAKALPLVRRLKEKAHICLTAAQSDPTGKGALWRMTPPEGEDDELEIFAGKTRLVKSARPSPSPAVSPPEAPPVRPEGMVYDQAFKPQIAPPAPPPMPTLPGPSSLTPDGSWVYSPQGYPVPYSTQSHTTHHPEYNSPTTPFDRQPPHPGYTNHAWAQPSHAQHVAPHGHHAPLPPIAHQPLRVASQHHHQYSEQGLSQYRGPATPQQESFMRDRSASQVFPTAPTFQGVQQTYAPPTELVNLGLASRESRLDERWATFMHESGYLDELNFRP